MRMRMYSFDFNRELTRTSQRALLHGWWRWTTSVLRCTEHRAQSTQCTAQHCTQQTLCAFFGPSIFPLYSMHYSCRYVPPIPLGWTTFAQKDCCIWPDSMQSTLFSHFLCAKIQERWSGHYLFILLKLHCSLNARYAGEWRLIDGLENCGKHMRSTRFQIQSPVARSLIHK